MGYIDYRLAVEFDWAFMMPRQLAIHRGIGLYQTQISPLPDLARYKVEKSYRVLKYVRRLTSFGSFSIAHWRYETRGHFRPKIFFLLLSSEYEASLNHLTGLKGELWHWDSLLSIFISASDLYRAFKRFYIHIQTLNCKMCTFHIYTQMRALCKMWFRFQNLCLPLLGLVK